MHSSIIIQQIDDDKVCLPCVRYSKGAHPYDIAEAPEVRLFGQTFLQTNHLQILSIPPAPCDKSYACIAEISREDDVGAVCDAVENTAALRLVDVDEIKDLSFDLGLSRILADVSATLLGHISGRNKYPSLAPRWTRHGFSSTARRWITKHLWKAHKLPEIDTHVAMLSSWPLGCVLVVTPLSRNLSKRWYFKATPSRKITTENPATDYDRVNRLSGSGFGIEACMYRYVARSSPLIVPTLIASDTEYGYILSEDAGKPLRFTDVDKEAISNFLRLYVDLQKRSADHVEELLNTGFADRRMCKLSGRVREAIEKTSLTNLPSFEHLYPRLEYLCTEIENEGEISATLVHGDMHNGNLLYDGERLRLADWADGCVAHPLIDINNMEKGRLRENYIKAIGVSSRALEIGQPLMLLDEFVIYSRVFDNGPNMLQGFGRRARNCLYNAVGLLMEGLIEEHC